MATKNLGQVSGVFIGTVPPDNIAVIWYDSTPSIMCHKVYDVTLSQWVIIDQKIVSLITYSELTNLATTTGLSVAKYYKIQDLGNVLAVAITTTKIQYTDSLGNILVDDLGTNIQYHVTSSNLLIDDLAGVFDNVNKKLIFTFNEYVPVIADDFVLGKVLRSGNWGLGKFKISSFLSAVTGNVITWNGGFYFNFTTAINAIKDITGGIVSKTLFDATIANQNISINNVAAQNQSIIDNASAAIAAATTDTEIYSKQIVSPTVTGSTIDIATGDSLHTIASKFQRWINQFKFANGIRITTNFADATTPAYINNNDTVDSAFRKVQYWLKNIYATLVLSTGWAPYNYTGTIADLTAGDSMDESFKKVQGKLNQIGDISNGKIESKGHVVSTGTSIYTANLGEGLIELYDPLQINNKCTIDVPNGYVEMKDGSGYSKIGKNGIMTNVAKSSLYSSGVVHAAAIVGIGNGNVAKAFGDETCFLAGVAGSATNSNATPAPAFGGYFDKLKINGMFIKVVQTAVNYVMLSTDVWVSIYSPTEGINISLPPTPYTGQCCYVRSGTQHAYNVLGNGNTIAITGTPTAVSSIAKLGTDWGQTLKFTFDGNYWLLNTIS